MSEYVTATRVVVDVHTHFMPPDLPDFWRETGDSRWPRLVRFGPDQADIMLGEAQFRRVSRPCWDPATRLKDMDDFGVDVQVMSPVPIGLTYWADPVLALAFAREYNDRLASAAAGSGGRLVGLGTVPLQDVDAAIDEMHRAVGQLGLVGLQIGTVIGTDELDHPRLRPFFRAAAEFGVPLFVHPVDGSGATRCCSPLGAFGLGMPTDTAIAATALVFGGVLADAPDLRICLAHGGGSFPLLYARLRAFAELTGSGSTDFDDLARRLYVDSLTFDSMHLPLLGYRFGSDHILFGSDYPFVPWAAAAASAGRPSKPKSTHLFLGSQVRCAVHD
jgi:aminocarboxymuconate-semialdehyde decarboxylase